jgi:cytochrome-b5 reductase
MIAGGSGITPIYNVAAEIFRDKEDHVEIIIISCHKTEKDILLRKELEVMKDRMKIYYMIDNHFEGWAGLVGHVCREVLEKITPLEE